MVQWLGFCAYTASTRVRSLVTELRFHKLGCMAGKKKKKTSEDLLISKSDNYSKCLKSKMKILSMNTGVPKTLNFPVLEFRRKTIPNQRE